MVSEIVQGFMRQQNQHLQVGQTAGTGQAVGPQPSGAGAPGSNPSDPVTNLCDDVSGTPASSARPIQQRQEATSQGGEPSFVTAFRNILQQGNVSYLYDLHLALLFTQSYVEFTFSKRLVTYHMAYNK